VRSTYTQQETWLVMPSYTNNIVKNRENWDIKFIFLLVDKNNLPLGLEPSSSADDDTSSSSF